MKFLRIEIAMFACFFSCTLSSQEIQGLKPDLTVNNHPICASLLSSVLDTYKGKNTSYFPKKTGIKRILVPIETKAFSDGFSIDGERVYLRSHTNPGCGGGCETYQTLASTSNISSPNNKKERNTYRKLLKNSPPASSGGTLLARTPTNSYFGIVETHHFLSVYQLTSEARWLESCKIQLKPERIDEISGLPETLVSSIKKVVAARKEMAGGSGRCGSLNAAGRLTHQFKSKVPLLISRPWVLESKETSGRRSYAVVMERLENWSLKGVDNQNKLKNYKNGLFETNEKLIDFYTDYFGWSVKKSEHIAQEALKNLVETGFSFPLNSPVRMSGENEIRRTILSGDTISQIDFDYKKYKEKLDKKTKNHENLLTIAVNNPSALGYLLKQGLNVDRKNPFGKTALMYAAQYDRLEAAQILLKAGADVNSETHIPVDKCNFVIKTSGYTPLHYASRYASRNLVELLLDAGASPYAKTGGKYGENKNKYPRDWLPENDKLTTEDVAILNERLSVPLPEEARQLSVRFNRDAERAYSEGDADSAYRMLLNAIQLDEKNYRALSNMSLIALRVGYYKKALQAGVRLVNSDASDKQKAAAYFNIGLTLEDYFTQDPDKWSLYLDSDWYKKAHIMDSLLKAYQLTPSEARSAKLIEHLYKIGNVSCPEAGENSFSVTRKYDWSLIDGQRKRAQRIVILRRGVSGIDKVCWSSDTSSGAMRSCTSDGQVYDLNGYSLSVFKASDYQLGDTPSYSVTIDDISCTAVGASL